MLGSVTAVIVVISIAIGVFWAVAGPTGRDRNVIEVTAPVSGGKSPDRFSPEEKMQRRYPQLVKVGDLIGLPVLDDADRILGHVQSVKRTADGKVQLLVPFGGFLGFRQRLVAVPIELVAIAGRQLAALDMTRAQFDAAPTWNDPQSQPIAVGDSIRIGLYRR
jgi:PRC-barrel domain